MQRSCRILLIAWYVWLSPLSAQTGNILEAYNGDFESGMVQWRFFEVPASLGSTATVITTGAARGTKAINVTYVAAVPSLVDRGFDNWEANVPVVGGQSYTASVQARTDSPGTLHLIITFGFFDSNRGVLAEQSQGFVLTDTYQTFSVQSNAPAEAQYSWVAFRLKDESGQYAAGTLYLDDAQLIGVNGPPPPPFVPKVMTTTLESDDIPIASINIIEPPYSAANDGSTDVTTLFQQAIDYAASKGGGVVFVPAGSYRFDGSLTMKEKVTLRGEWQNPDSGGNGKGTIFRANGGAGNENGTPFISINRGSGIKNLTIWYPQQSISPVPYPWTILCNPDNAAGRGDNTSIINVTLVNSYQAMKVGPASNELHYIRSVYGSPLKTGIWLSQTTDIGRIMNVHFEPKYWASSTLSGSPVESAVKQWTQANAEGIVLGRSDWEYMYDISLVGYKTGVRIFRYDPSGPAANGVIYGLHTEEGEVGIRFEMVNPYGFAITGSTINVSAGENPVCVLATNGFSTIAQFNTCSFGGSPKAAILFEDNSLARITFQNCTFSGWGRQDNDPAVSVQEGSVAILGSEFTQDRMHVYLGEGVPNAQILDNTVPSKLRVSNLSLGEVEISQESLQMPKLQVAHHPFGKERRPATNALFVVSDYGAVGDKITDDTPAFQAALDAAGTAGGGTVYVPAGWYNITSHLSVPSGVDLRGIWDIPHHTVSQGTVLLASEGGGNASGTPFIVLQHASGVRGLTIWYPNQNYAAYPWTVQVQGADCWVRDVTLANAYQGIDLASYPSPNHFISYVGGSPLKTGIHVSNNPGEGWIENVQFNSHYWKRSSGYPKNANPDLNLLTPYQQANLDAVKVGSCLFEHQLGNFVFAANRGLYFVNDGGGCRSDVFLHGTDAGTYGIAVESPVGSELNIVNSQLVLTAAVPQSYIYTGASFGGRAHFANSLEWGNQSGLSADIRGAGFVVLQQINTSASRINLVGGTVFAHGISISTQFAPQFTLSAPLSECGLFGNYSPSGFQMTGSAAGTTEADYNFQHINRSFSFSTGWETGQPQNKWNNTLYSLENVLPAGGQDRPQCVAVDQENGRALTVTGKDNSATASGCNFKIFKTKIPVYSTSSVSYSLRPQTELGRSVHLDLLFDDGSRLCESQPVANDGLALAAARGSVDQWSRVDCPLGVYAAGKTIQEILVGYHRPEDMGDFIATIDSLAITASPNIPLPWLDADIGTVSQPGMSMSQNDAFELLGSGTGVQYGGDSFYLLYQPWKGDVVITARLDDMSQLPGVSFAGVMIRESQSSTSRFVFLGLYPQTGLQTSIRLTPVSSIQPFLHEQYVKAAPRWLRIIRTHDTFSTFTSEDGVSWSDTLYTGILAMDSTVKVGMAICAGSTDETADARFSNVTVASSVTTGVSNVGMVSLPHEYRLLNNYPNPFNPATTIRFELPEVANVDLEVYNVHGQKVATLFHGTKAAGRYQLQWDGRTDSGGQVSSGFYVCRFLSGTRQFTSKMLLIR